MVLLIAQLLRCIRGSVRQSIGTGRCQEGICYAAVADLKSGAKFITAMRERPLSPIREEDGRKAKAALHSPCDVTRVAAAAATAAARVDSATEMRFRAKEFLCGRHCRWRESDGGGKTFQQIIRIRTDMFPSCIN